MAWAAISACVMRGQAFAHQGFGAFGMQLVLGRRLRLVATKGSFALLIGAASIAFSSDAFAISARCQQLATRTTLITNFAVPIGTLLSVSQAPLEAGETVTFYVTDATANNTVNVTTQSRPVTNVGSNTNIQFMSANGTQAFTQTVAVGDNDANITFTQAAIDASITVEAICVAAAPATNQPTNSQILEQTRQVYSMQAAQTSSQVIGDATSGAINDAFSGQGVTRLSPTQFSTNFSAVERTRDAEDEQANAATSSDPFAAMAYAKSRMSSKAPMFKKAPPPVLRSPWHVWIDGRFTGFEDKRATSFDGWQNHVTAGASYMFTQNFLAGVLVGYENFKYSVVAAGVPASLNGSGITGGGYFGWKFFDRMRLDGMLTYGRIDYTAGAGGVVGSFGADRISGMGKVSGRYGMGAFFLEPSAMLTVASERQDSFVDSAAVLHNKFNFTVGRASTGGTVGTPLAWGTSVVTPTFGAFADYRFGDETLAAASVIPTINNGWSARVNGGVSVAMPNNVTASATGEYGGLGNPIEYWRAKANLGVKF